MFERLLFSTCAEMEETRILLVRAFPNIKLVEIYDDEEVYILNVDDANIDKITFFEWAFQTELIIPIIYNCLYLSTDMLDPDPPPWMTNVLIKLKLTSQNFLLGE